jgi:hypothetical protein
MNSLEIKSEAPKLYNISKTGVMANQNRSSTKLGKIQFPNKYYNNCSIYFVHIRFD